MTGYVDLYSYSYQHIENGIAISYQFPFTYGFFDVDLLAIYVKHKNLMGFCFITDSCISPYIDKIGLHVEIY